MYGRRPLSRLQAGVYAAIATVLMGVFLERMLHLLATAEREIVALTLANTELALRTRVAAAPILGGPLPLDWRNRSPFGVAGVEAKNYAGELAAVRAEALARGAWAFDRESRELVYRPRYPLGLRTADGSGLLRFRLRTDDGTEVGLIASVPYRWDP